MDMRPGLGVNRQNVGAGFGKGIEIGVGRRNHQMDVDDQRRVRAQRLDHHRPDGNVGNEMPVHDIDMDVIGAGSGDRTDFRPQIGEIRRQDRRGDANGTLH